MKSASFAHRRAIIAGMWLAAALLPMAAFADTLLHVGNLDTHLALQAGPSAPRLLRLSGDAGPAWTGTVAATLIDRARVNGRNVPLHWRFNRVASRVRADSVSLVYDTAHPHLRLTWEWRARAPRGPLEHSIRIENRTAQELWIPLQDSFRFGWKLATNQALQQLWIDKGAGEARPSAPTCRRSPRVIAGAVHPAAMRIRPRASPARSFRTCWCDRPATRRRTAGISAWNSAAASRCNCSGTATCSRAVPGSI
ncbi:hypothetical protein HFP05_17645, partial [Rhodanobacter denitrificans]|nr:hypothetical protein [Rhodanobacter denitrificans]